MTGKFPGGKTYSVSALAKQLGFSFTFKLNKADARNIVQEAIIRGIIRSETEELAKGSMSLLIPFVEEICNYDTSPWVRYENKRKEHPLSRKYVTNMRRAFMLHAKPNIEKKTTIASFSKSEAKALQDKMSEEGVSPDNINLAIKAMRTAYNYAIQEDMIKFNPFDYLKPYVAKREEKKILSRAEAKQVLELMEAFAQESSARRAAYLATKPAIFSGMRQGEIRAFSLDKMSIVKDDKENPTDFRKIEVDEDWVDEEKRKGPTKGRYRRTTVIHASLAQELIDFAKDHCRKSNELLFSSPSEGMLERPYVKNVFQKYFYDAVHAAGISEESRKERHIDFHSLRHFYESESKANAQKLERYVEEIRAAIGHKNKTVDELIYTHDTPTRLITLGVMSEHILET